MEQRGARPSRSEDRSGPGRHRVVIVGGGFGGLPAARILGFADVDVVLIDRGNHHLFQPLLYQVATGILSEGQIAAPLRQVLRRHRNITVELAQVTDIDLANRVVRAERFFDQTVDIPYDSLIVATGAGQSYFGHDEFAVHAPGMKTLDDALEIRRRIFGALEVAESAAEPEVCSEWMTMVVVGAGPTGVELAGQIRELATRSLIANFRNIDPGDVRVVLIDAGKEPLASFGDRLSGDASRFLLRAGVELRMNTRVTGVDGSGVDVTGPGGDEHITARTVIWAAGVQASPLAGLLAEATGVEVDHAGRIAVLGDLTLPGHPEVFVVGDMVSLDDLPGVAEVAMQGGIHAARSIIRRRKGEPTDPFRYRDLGSMATLGRFRAVLSVGRLKLTGFPAWLVWAFVHIVTLSSVAGRLGTLFRWAGAMIGHKRDERNFSVGRTGGDVSLPVEVRAEMLATESSALSRIHGNGDGKAPKNGS
ncbi:MAG: NAD(P)/FAD-dependent oxidoreductase [Actinomycetota bacterium]|nr:NAD(P)/FAD-dependent oxidoreductase [Actinomycetota bacterium]